MRGRGQGTCTYGLVRHRLSRRPSTLHARPMAAVTSDQTLPARRHDHIVDQLIVERAPKMAASPLWPVLRLALYRVLDYQKARRMADTIAPMSGQDALDFVSALLALKVEAE